MSKESALLDPFYSTFVASLRSVGTACTLAAVGIYLHRRRFISTTGKRTLALISQQVTIPLFLFTKVVYCNQDWSSDPCPDVRTYLQDVWILLVWPVFVVFCGLLVGWMAAWYSQASPQSFKSILAACAFGNSTGLPLTLLAVVRANFRNSRLGDVDPTLFLAIYLLLYPVLQWGIGGWLLASDDDNDDRDQMADKREEHVSASLLPITKSVDVATDHVLNITQTESPVTEHPCSRRQLRRGSSSFGRNVLNNKEVADMYKYSRRGIHESDASLYMSTADLVEFGQTYGTDDDISEHATSTSHTEEENVMSSIPHHDYDTVSKVAVDSSDDTTSHRRGSDMEEDSIVGTLQQIASRCLQPPAVGAMLGMCVATSPVRQIFVDLADRDDDAPLEWFFDGLYAVGQAAVPINMIILGCNLSASRFRRKWRRSSNFLSSRTMFAIVVGKMLVMPLLGIVSVICLKAYVWNVPIDIAPSFYLVAMIVFITPTANNVMIMVELSGSGSKEGIAQVIAWQYAVAPILLSLTMSAAIWVARQ